MTSDHRVHGMGLATTAPTWPAVTVDEAEAVLERFPAAGRLIGLSWHSPRPFSAATLAQTGEGEFILKRHHRRVRTPAALGEEHAFIAHLRRAGLPVPELIAADDGTGAIAQGDWTYELHRKSPGLDLYADRPSWTPFLSHHHAFEAGAALGRLHLAARGFAGLPRDRRALVASFTILPAANPLAAPERYVAARPALTAVLADQPWQQELARLFMSIGGLPQHLAEQPPLWTHNDWHPSNLLWTSDGTVSTVFDFGLATQTCAVHDLAIAIASTAIAWLELVGGACATDVEAALQLVAGYRTVAPLSRTDVATIARLLPLVHVEFALSEIDYFAGILGDRDQAMLAWNDYLIGHADWFASSPGRKFVQEFERGAVD